MSFSWRRPFASFAAALAATRDQHSSAPHPDLDRSVHRDPDPVTRRAALLAEVEPTLREWMPDRALDRVARLAAVHLGGWCTVDVVEEGSLLRRGSAHANPARDADVDHLYRRLAAASAFYPTAETIQTLEPRIIGPAEPASPYREAGSSLLVPIRTRDRTWGLITLASDERRYAAADLALMDEVADRAALAVERGWLYREMHRCRSRLEAVLHHIPTGVVIAEAPSGRRVLDNDAVERIFRYSMAGIRTLADWSQCRAFDRRGRPYRAEEWPLARSLASGETVVGEEMEIIRGDGTRAILHVNASPIREGDGRIVAGVATFEDVTPSRTAAEETQAHTLESIGLLAGGIAHDFNNALTAIAGNLFLVKTAVGLDDAALKKIDDAEHATLRAKYLTQQLLTFAPGGAPLKQPTTIGRLVRDAVESQLEGSPVRPEFRIPDDVWPGDIDEAQIRQVLAHIVSNAREAMPGGGRVTVEIRNRVVGPDDRLPLDPGRYIAVWIIDQGIGILPADLPHVFDPYYTTKPTHRGLGLTTCYSIVKKHRGYLAADSTPGVRTTFTVFLPAAVQPVGPAASGTPSPGAGAVLFMDDEAAIREFAFDMLDAFGYRAVCARDGAEAVERYREAAEGGKPFDAVILDLTVPGGMGGLEAFGLIRRLDPEVRAIVSSGYSRDPIVADFARYGFAAALPKPYEGDHLRETLARILRSARSAAGSPPLV